jgi:hypothetical protein
VKLLGRFDPLLLAHRDKTWLVDGERYDAVWRPAGHIEATLLVGGRVAGTWRYKRRANTLDVTLAPFGRLTKAVRRAIERQASGMAHFFGLSDVVVGLDG